MTTENQIFLGMVAFVFIAVLWVGLDKLHAVLIRIANILERQSEDDG